VASREEDFGREPGLHIVSESDLEHMFGSPAHYKLDPVPAPPLWWGWGSRAWFGTRVGAEAREAADFWLQLLAANSPSTRLHPTRFADFAGMLHKVAHDRGMTRFTLRDQDAATLSGVSNVHSYQHFRRLLHDAGWLRVQKGSPRKKGTPGRSSKYALTLPREVVEAYRLPVTKAPSYRPEGSRQGSR
jgi:hypothetical protein